MNNNEIDIFSFLSIRDSQKLTPQETRKKYVRDDAYFFVDSPLSVGHSVNVSNSNQLITRTGIQDVDIFSKQSLSQVGKAIIASLDSRQTKSQIIKKIEDILIAGFKYSAGVLNCINN